MENEFIRELLTLAGQAQSAQELLALAKEQGMGLDEAQAEALFTRLNTQGELSDEELDGIVGGAYGTHVPLLPPRKGLCPYCHKDLQYPATKGAKYKCVHCNRTFNF